MKAKFRKTVDLDADLYGRLDAHFRRLRDAWYDNGREGDEPSHVAIIRVALREYLDAQGVEK